MLGGSTPRLITTRHLKKLQAESVSEGNKQVTGGRVTGYRLNMKPSQAGHHALDGINRLRQSERMSMIFRGNLDTARYKEAPR